MNCATAAFDFDLESLTRLQEDADIMTYILFSAALGDVFEEPEVIREYIVRLPEILRKLRLPRLELPMNPLVIKSSTCWETFALQSPHSRKFVWKSSTVVT